MIALESDRSDRVDRSELGDRTDCADRSDRGDRTDYRWWGRDASGSCNGGGVAAIRCGQNV